MRHAPFTAEHARQLRFVRSAAFAGDDALLYTVTEVDDALRERESLWLFDLAGGQPRRIAAGLVDVRAPACSPCGAQVAALAESEGRRQVVLIPLDGGEPRSLTRLPQGVAGSLTWSPDGRSLAFVAGPRTARDPSRPHWVDRLTYRADGLGWVEDAVTDLYVVDVASGALRQLTDDRCMNAAPRWSPDGRSLAYLVSHRPDRVEDWQPELHVVDVEGGDARVLVGDWGGVLAAAWCADGERIAFAGAPGSTSLAEIQRIDVWTVGLDGDEPACRTAGLAAGVGVPRLETDLPIARELSEPRLCVQGDAAYVSGALDGTSIVQRVALRGEEAVELALAWDGSSCVVDVHPHHGILHLAGSRCAPPELFLGKRPVSALNGELLSGLVRPQVRALDVTAEDGVRFDAWALTPPGEGPWPTVLAIHGGPWAAVGDVFTIDHQLLVGAGIAVVAHNFRGSSGYGADFSRLIAGDWGRRGALDHHAALDEAIRAGVADPDRLGAFGLSHGGFATCWLLGTSDRFKAGLAENPIVSFDSFYGVADTAWWMPAELGGAPHEAPDAYRDRSPLAVASSCTTPLLFVVGDADLRCDPVEAEQYHRVLLANGVPTAMLRLPGSSHEGSAYGPVPARIAQNEALVDWFARHLTDNERRTT